MTNTECLSRVYRGYSAGSGYQENCSSETIKIVLNMVRVDASLVVVVIAVIVALFTTDSWFYVREILSLLVDRPLWLIGSF